MIQDYNIDRNILVKRNQTGSSKMADELAYIIRNHEAHPTQMVISAKRAIGAVGYVAEKTTGILLFNRADTDHNAQCFDKDTHRQIPLRSR